MVFKSEISDYDKVEFEDYKKNYWKQNYRCQKDLGFLYNNEDGSLNDIRCKKWDCEYCRILKKYGLYIEILKNIYNFDLDKHFIITTAGNEFRSKYNWIESFYYMNKQWDLLKKVIEYKYGKLTYIVLPRSQKNGYCHYHTILSKKIPWEFLNEKRKKYDLGFVSIQKNKDLAEYLCTDYFKDDEWVIPEKIKHYRSSRDIMLNNFESDKNYTFINNKTSLDQVEKLVRKIFGNDFDKIDYEFRHWLNNFNTYVKRKEVAL